MGTLHYGASHTTIRLDDRALAHLQTVITTKMRRNEPFLIQVERGVEQGSGRCAFWLHPTTELIYEYDGSREPSLDPAELDRMMIEASGTRGLRIPADERVLV